MFIFSFLFSLSYSKFERFSQEFFEKSVEKSEEIPVFALFYLQQEQRSSIVLPRFQAIMDSYTNDQGIGFQIECSEDYFVCAKYKAKYFPSILAIKSKDPFFQKLYNGNFTESSIHNFIDTIINPKIVKINDLSVTDSFTYPTSDTSVPLMIVPKKNNSREKDPEILNEIAPYVFASNRTLYSYDSETFQQELRLYIAPNCYLKYKDSLEKEKVLKFINNNRYNIYHQFTYEEFSSYFPDMKMILVVSFKGLTEEYSTILSDVSAKMCGRYVFGWVNPFSDRRFNVTFKQDPEDPTVFAYVDRTEHKVFKLLKKPDSQLVHQFILNVTHYYEKGEDWDNGWAIFGSFILIIILSVFLIGYNNAYQSCLNWVNELCF